ncbi:MAG: transglycosylase domain-containing protein [Muribaculaceae bacterium]|nr:transglycosylase domain-containing protein [Muribaculaceae bacterium]
MRTKKIIVWMWGIFLGGGFLIALFLLLIYNGVIGYMPPIEELEDPHSKLASVVYASDGTTELGRYFIGNGNRINNDYDNISPHVIDALIATEDVRFDDHSGVDFRALGRSMVKTVLLRDKSSGGGSTITQQLAKQLYSQPTGNVFKRAMQKPIEWMIAIKLERFYTKKEILAMYLNRFDFLNNAVGIKTAANVYFGKEPEDLNIQEAAMLVGMLKNPSLYNPLRFEERTRDRRNVVLDQMVKAGKLTASQADSLKGLPIELDYHRVDFHEGGAPYLREEIRRLMTAKKPIAPRRDRYANEVAWNIAVGNYKTDSTEWENNALYGWLEKNPKPNGQKYDLYTDGLRIYSTIDVTMQRYAEEAVNQHLGGVLQPAFFNEKKGPAGPYNSPRISAEQARKFINNAIRQTERWRTMKLAGIPEEDILKSFDEKYTMDVFAYEKKGDKYVPSSKTVEMSPRDSLLYMKTILRTGLMSMDPVTGSVKAYVGGPDFYWFQYDMAGRGKRQIGSTMKPFLYTLALEDSTNYTPCTTILNSQPRFGNWSPRNSGGGRVGEMVDLKWALTTSNNWISAKLLNDLQPVNLVNKLRMFGISGYIEPTLPLSLGTNDVSVKEMVSAYSTFANDGLRVDPVYVTRIEDNQGNVIYSAIPHHEEVTSQATCYKMITMIRSVIDNGTGRALRGSYGISADMGGKTGTTNSNSDSWFIGVTPELVTGVWVGGEERTIRFNTMALGQGAKAALPIYGLYMRKVYADKKLPYSQDAKFNIPDGYNPCGGFSWESEPIPESALGETVEGIFD